MYDIAFSVAGCLRAGTQVDVAWVVDAHGFGADQDAPGAVTLRTQAVAMTPGGGRMGSLLSGALDAQLADVVVAGGSGRLVAVRATEIDALAAGLAHGGDARVLLLPAGQLPAQLWELLSRREPVCLVTRLDGDRALDTVLFTRDTVDAAGDAAARLFRRGVSDVAVEGTRATTVLWPVATLVIVGGGPVAAALEPAARLLGWQVRTLTDPNAAAGVIATLAALDKVVVAAHDLDVAGPALEAALSSEAGYIGSVGSRQMQQARAEWLAYRDVTDLRRLHGPAGLDIGAGTPGEIAVSILAEAIAARSASARASSTSQPG